MAKERKELERETDENIDVEEEKGLHLQDILASTGIIFWENNIDVYNDNKEEVDKERKRKRDLTNKCLEKEDKKKKGSKEYKFKYVGESSRSCY